MSDYWELTFHNDDSGKPAWGYIDQQNPLLSAGSDPDGIYFYSTVYPSGLTLDAGQTYWFSVANWGPDWTWATPGVGPTVGSEAYDATQSTGTGPDGGPIQTDSVFEFIPVGPNATSQKD